MDATDESLSMNTDQCRDKYTTNKGNTDKDDIISLEREEESFDDVSDRIPAISDDEYDVPKDKGWAWVVLFGTLLEMTLMMGMAKCTGIMFVAFQEKFNSSSSMTSLISTIQNIVFSLSSPIVLSVGKQLTSSRKLVFIGCSIMFLSYIITSQARGVGILFLSYGILQGLGNAFMIPVAIVTLASYFDKRRGFANSLALSGSSLGGFLLAPLVTYLFKMYGYQGCFLIIAGILFHGFICGALFRPHSFYKRKYRTPIVNSSQKMEQNILIPQKLKSLHSLCDVVPEDNFSHKITNEKIKISSNPEEENGNENDEIVAAITQELISGNLYETKPNLTTDSSTESQTVNQAHSLQKINGSLQHMACSMVDISVNALGQVKDNTRGKLESDTSVKTMFKTLIRSFDFKLFRNPLFCILQLASFIICANSVLCTIFLSPLAKDVGLADDEIALIVTVYSATDFVSRVILGAIADCGCMRRSNMTALTVFVVGITANFVRFYTTFELLMFYGVILGLFSGVYFSLFAVILVDYLTIQKLQAAFGFTALFHGAGMSLFFYVIGYLRDVTGSYVIPFHLMGCLNLVGSALHFSLPFVERYYSPKETQNG